MPFERYTLQYDSKDQEWYAIGRYNREQVVGKTMTNLIKNIKNKKGCTWCKKRRNQFIVSYNDMSSTQETKPENAS